MGRVASTTITECRLVSVEAAAQYLSVSRRVVEQLLSSGKIPSRKLGRLRRIDIKELDKFVDSLPRRKFEEF